MLSLKHGGAQFPTIVGKYLGSFAEKAITIISIVLMILVAAAFTAGPAQLIAQITPLSFMAALILVFGYFILAAVLPINKIIGRIYPGFRRYPYFYGNCNRCRTSFLVVSRFRT